FADGAPADAGSTHERMRRELADAVEAMTVERPLVLVLEDLHWSDHSTLELLSALARRPERARLLIIGTYRPPGSLPHDHPLRAVVQELRLHRQCQEIRLPFLDEVEVGEYVAWRFERPEARWTGGVARGIHRSTEGNPLFMVHVVDDLVERGVLVRDGGRWLTTGGLTIEAPADVRQMIERQLDALPEDDQHVLEAASVAGTEVSAAAVAAAPTRPPDALGGQVPGVARGGALPGPERGRRLARRHHGWPVPVRAHAPPGRRVRTDPTRHAGRAAPACRHARGTGVRCSRGRPCRRARRPLRERRRSAARARVPQARGGD